VKKGPVNSYSLKWSLSLHGTLLMLAVVLPLLPMFRKKELSIPLDFTVVLEENEVEPNVPPQPEPPTKTPEPPPKSVPLPDPPKPLPLPDPPKDAVVIKKTEKPKPPEKKPEPPQPKPPEKKPDPPKPPEKKPFVKGTRVEARPPQPTQDFTKLKPVTTAPVTEKRLTKAEIAKALQDGAKPGTRNQVPQDEMERCYRLILEAFYNVWEQPAKESTISPVAHLEVRLDDSGRVASYRIVKSSGNAYFDQTVLKAAANVAPIRGLSLAFLRQHDRFPIEFKLE